MCCIEYLVGGQCIEFIECEVWIECVVDLVIECDEWWFDQWLQLLFCFVEQWIDVVGCMVVVDVDGCCQCVGWYLQVVFDFFLGFVGCCDVDLCDGGWFLVCCVIDEQVDVIVGLMECMMVCVVVIVVFVDEVLFVCVYENVFDQCFGCVEWQVDEVFVYVDCCIVCVLVEQDV